jgi:hypothetical protein
MTQKSKTAAFLAGEFISEDAVRGALGRRRARRAPSPSGAGDPAAADGDRSAARPDRGTPLRRWSVAELIANGVGRRVDSVGH